MARNSRLVYSTSGSHRKICQICKDDPCSCKKVLKVQPEETTVKLRLEKKGRGGKSVTVLYELPHNPDYFTKLSKKLKSYCGSGGTCKDGTIEIQGNQLEKVRTFLEKEGFKVKG